MNNRVKVAGKATDATQHKGGVEPLLNDGLNALQEIVDHSPQFL